MSKTTRRRFGSARRLPSGRWQARYRGPDGQIHSAPDTYATEREADRWLAATETDIDRCTWLSPRPSRETLAAYAEAWIAQRTVAGRPIRPRTRDTYLHSLRFWIAPMIGGLPLNKVKPAVVRTWHAEVSAQTGPTATRQAYALLKAVMTTAVEDGAVPRNPCLLRGAGQPSSPERPLLSYTEVVALADAMPPHLRAASLITFWAHLRIGELVGLERGDLVLDGSEPTLRVSRQVVEQRHDDGSPGKYPVVGLPKASSQRSVALPSQAVDVLRAHLAAVPLAMPTARVFTRPDGGELRAHHVQGAWRVARRHVGLAEVHFHDLRHAGLTLVAQLGGTNAELMARAGHSTDRMVQHYQHAARSRDLEIARRMGELG